MQKTLYVGLDVRKATLSITAAEEGRGGAVRCIGTIPNTPLDVAKLAKRLSKTAVGSNSAMKPADADMASIASSPISGRAASSRRRR
jgi:hypothetical protein